MAENSLEKKSNLADTLMKVLVPIRHIQIAIFWFKNILNVEGILFNLRTP